MLTEQEVKTREAYREIARTRNQTHSDSSFWQKEFDEFGKLVPRGRVLEVGCGAGRDAQLLNPRYDYIGTDLVPEMILESRKLVPSARFRVMNAYNLSFPDNAFDGFWASAVFLHMPKNKIGLALNEVVRVSKDGAGGFMAVKKKLPNQKDSAVIKDRFFVFYEQEEWHSLLSEHGLEVVKSYEDHRQYDPPDNLTIWLICFVRVKKH